MPQNSIFSGRFYGRAWGLLRYLTLVLWAVWLCASAGSTAAQAQFRAGDRILEPVESARFSATRGNLQPSARPEFDRGPVDPAMRLGRVTMVFSQTAEQQAELQALLGELQDSSSANYHRWLTPETFADRFGLSQLDVDKVVSWLQAQGLTVEQVSRSRTWVAFSGTARQVDAALRTSLRHYAARGETHFAMSREPSVPSALADVVLGFRGLHDFRLKARGIRKVSRRFTSEVSGAHFLAPDDFATIYALQPLYSGGIDGTGQTIAVVGQSAIDVSDVQTFRSLSGLPVNDPENDPQLVPVDPAPVDFVPGDVDEAYLDVEWAGAVARRATILYVYSENVLDAFFHVIDENLAPVLSISYGLCEGGTDGFSDADANILASAAQQANAQGITIVGPSGDAGAADCDHSTDPDTPVTIATQGLAVDLPAALPYVTAVGGTRFNEGSGNYWNPTNDPSTNASARSYIPETAWNDTDATGLAASGGGSSIYFPQPSWQTGNGVPVDPNSRHVPDVSFAASAEHDGYLVCSQDYDSTSDTFSPSCENGFRRVDPDPLINGSLTVFGGTSVGVPSFAGVVALINQQTNSPQGQGNINYILYPLAANFPAALHDITSGNNRVPCDQGDPLSLPPRPPSPDCPTSGPNAGFIGFDAGPGYDRVTGLGSVDAFSLVTAWTSVSSTPASKGSTAPDFQLALSPPNLTVSRGGSATAQLTVTSINGFAGSVNVSCNVAAALAGVTCSVSGGAGVGTRTVTVSASSGSFGMVGHGGPGAQGLSPEMLLFCLWIVGGGIWAVASAANGRRLRWAPAFACACLLVVFIGCKGGGDGNGDDTGVVPVTAGVSVQGTSGNITHTAQLSVTAN